MPDLKDTILKKVLDHIEGDLEEGVDYVHNIQKGSILFKCVYPHSEIISRSWHDKKYKKFRSIEASAAAIEELTENNNEEMEFYTELVARVGRIKGIKESFIIAATNPDDPSHKAFDYFIRGSEENPNRHVYYSLTEQNPFLPEWYIPSLKQKYDAKMIQRLLEGKWIYIGTETIYYEYNPAKHYVLTDTKVKPSLPIRIAFDFNIALGKPMSAVLFQYARYDNMFTIIDEFVIEGARTQNIMDEITEAGYFDMKRNPQIIIHGDAAGRHKDTRSNNSDYDIIEKHLANYTRKDDQHLDYDIEVPRSNPSLRDRHNIVNGQLCNSEGRISILIDKRCETLDEGLSKTKLKKNAGYIEDDSPAYQHITTALGYGIMSTLESSDGIADIELR